MKVFLDDLRATPEGWVRCFWPTEVIDLLRTGQVVQVSLDHDLGDAETAKAEGRAEITGMDVLAWIQEQVFENNGVLPKPPQIVVHSDNASAIRDMRLVIASIWRWHSDNLQDEANDVDLS